MRTFSIQSLGCKVNHYESQQVREHLEHLGMAQVTVDKNPDLVVINTCCVTATASAKSRQCIRRTQRLSPHASVLVCGCLPSMPTHALPCPNDHTLVVHDRRDLTTQLTKIAGNAGCPGGDHYPSLYPDTTIRPNHGQQIKSADPVGPEELPGLTRFEGQTRAFLKVQDGCDGHCAYCIIPHTRPTLTSKPIETVVAEAQALVQAGHREIVITGVYLGAYGQHTVRQEKKTGPGPHLSDLLDRLAHVPDLARIRLSSLDPTDVTEDLVEVLQRHSAMMPHVHLSLQSGSDDVLRRMGRQYSADDFRRVVARVTTRLDRPAVTTDIIVGFPAETDDDFEQTLALAKEVGFAKMHVFAFSPRQGTAAAGMGNAVSNKTIQERSRVLRDLDQRLGRGFRDRFIGQTAQVLIEDTDDKPSGLSERYFTVYLDRTTDRPVQKNQIVEVKLLSHHKDGVLGER